MKANLRAESKSKILDAALYAIRAKGYAATTVDDICSGAEVTKGSFFHHFKSKDALALEAVEHFSKTTDALFATAPYRTLEDPLDRLLGYVDFRISGLAGELPDYTCLLGTLVQEAYDTHPAIRDACNRALSSHVSDLVRDVRLAKDLYASGAAWSPESVGYFIQSVLQGAFIFAKATQSPATARESLEHLQRYLVCLFPAKAGPVGRNRKLK